MADSPCDDRLIGRDVSSTSTIRFQDNLIVAAIVDENDFNVELENSLAINFVLIWMKNLLHYQFAVVSILRNQVTDLKTLN
jgi:hypothetical protein